METEMVRQRRRADKFIAKAKRAVQEKGDSPAHKAVAALRKERQLTREQLNRCMDF